MGAGSGVDGLRIQKIKRTVDRAVVDRWAAALHSKVGADRNKNQQN